MDAYVEVNYQSDLLTSKPVFGHVDFSDNSVDPATSTVSMRVEIPNAKKQLFPGTFVYVNVFVTDKFKFLGVPPQVIFEDQRGKFVYVLDKDDTAQRVYVKPVFENRFFTLIQQDQLQDGNRVVINALLRLKPGLKTAPNDVTVTKGLDAVLKEHHLIPDMPMTKEP